jgi:acyl carrier protein
MKSEKVDDSNLRRRVAAMIAGVLGEKYEPDARRLDLTSLQVLELIVAIEDEFNIHISEDAPLARITASIDSILEYLRTALQNPQQAR